MSDPQQKDLRPTLETDGSGQVFKSGYAIERTMDNLAAEIHDMTVKTIRLVGTTVVVELNATIYSTSGQPGFSPGVTWFQDAELLVADGVILQLPSPITLWATVGSIEVEGVEYDALIPLPFRPNGATRVHLEGHEGVLEITGSAAELILKGERSGEKELR